MSDDSDDDFVEFGTPLEPLEEDVCPRKKPLLIEDQVAKDKDGRRRFHGAFTGGFSAGFMNTVGSLEGFKPSSFKSSRSEKGAVVIQRPEDFMDDEDMGEFGIAPSILRAKDDYQSIETCKRKYPGYLCGPELGTVLRSLLQPVRETIGIKLLRKMGWKPGQGVGPRVTKHEKKRVSRMRQKVYGCALPNQNSEGEDSEASDIDDEDLKNITFAPSDYPFQLVTPKDNFFGLGYKGLDKRSILSAPVAKTEFNMKNRKTITGQAFGVGALEEEDEDIYSREDMSQYDFSLGDNAKDGTSASHPVIGDSLYDAFVLASKRKVVQDFKPPILPPDFKPVRKVTRFDQILNVQIPKKLEASPERKSTAEEAEEIQREARKLTENISSDAPEVFKPFAADRDKQRRYEKYLDLIAVGKSDDLHKLQPITMTDWERERERKEFDQAAKIFRPLSETIDDRFTAASQPDDVHDPLAPVERLTIATRDEIQAAKMNMYGDLTRTVEDWKPCSLLCKRFNIRELDHFDPPIVKENKSKSKGSIDFERSLLEAKTYEQEKDPRRQGRDSHRQERDQRQDREPRRHDRDTSHQEKDSRRREMASSLPEKGTHSRGASTDRHGNRETTSKPPEADVKEDDKKPKETEKSELDNLMQNKVDLFNAIFQDTDSEEEEVVVEVQNEGKITAQYFEPRKPAEEYDKDLGMQYEDDIVNDKRNTSPARGIFENLDYDLLVPKKQATAPSPQFDDAVPGPSYSEPPEVKDRVFKDPSPDRQYGPRLPDKFPERKFDYVPVRETANENENGVWVEKSKAQKKHKKSKKRKKSKEKSKYRDRDRDKDKGDSYIPKNRT